MSDDRTRVIPPEPNRPHQVAEVLAQVRQALEEKGYQPVVQIAGYLLSGDPAYITGHKNAREAIRTLPRDEIIEELVRRFLED